MKAQVEFIPGGTVTSPRGFLAGGIYAGIKKAKGSLDLGMLCSETPCTAAGLFTTNRIQAAPVIVSRERIKSGKATAVVVNSGCANACTGEQGKVNAIEMASLAARKLDLSSQRVLVASTGVIGKQLPMDLIRAGIDKIKLSCDGGHMLERAMMTTDTVPKEVAVKAVEGGFTIGGVAKGAGMIHPDMATFLCFLSTDAAVEKDFLKSALKKAADVSFNLVSVDGDTSTNDTVFLLANGMAANEVISRGSKLAPLFQQALNEVCIYLAKCVARDGEGATRLIEVSVEGAPGPTEARTVARTIITSPLVKTAVHGNDPNWGRIIAAAGRSGVDVIESRIDLYIGDICVLKSGAPQSYHEPGVVEVFKRKEVPIRLDLNLGRAKATAWGCDLSEEYVEINSQYMT